MSEYRALDSQCWGPKGHSVQASLLGRVNVQTTHSSGLAMEAFKIVLPPPLRHGITKSTRIIAVREQASRHASPAPTTPTLLGLDLAPVGDGGRPGMPRSAGAPTPPSVPVPP